jgi:uncharacterized protein YkwD
VKTTTVAIERPNIRHVRMLVGLFLALAVLAVPNRAMADPAGDAGTAVWLVNQTRAQYGLGELIPDRELQVVANAQANRMAESGFAFHTPDLGSQLSWGWYAWAENVGYGPSVEWLHGAFMASGHHAGNILDGRYNYVGIGVAYGSDGTVYISEVFGAW